MSDTINNTVAAEEAPAESVEKDLFHERRYVSPKEFIIYGIANGGQCTMLNLIQGRLTYFLTNVFNVDKRFISAMLFIEGIWDAANDPLMGTIIDRTRSRFGKLKPYLMLIPIPKALTAIIFFAGPLFIGNLAPNALPKLLFVTVVYILWEGLYTVGDVAFWGMSAGISPNPEERTKAITTARFTSGIVSTIIGLMVPIFIDLVNNGTIKMNMRNTFFLLAVFTNVFGVILFQLSAVFVHERTAQAEESPSFAESIKLFYTNKPLRLLILRDIVGALGGVGGIFGDYYMIDVLNTLSISILTGIPGAVTNFVGYALLPKFRKWMNNKQILIFLRLYDTINPIIRFLIGIGGGRYKKLSFMVPVMAVDSALGGLKGAAGSVVPTDMIGETVDYSEWTTGQRTEGMSFSILTFSHKFASAFSRGFGVFLLSLIGYQTSNETAKMPQTEAVKQRLFAMTTIVPALLGLFSLIPIMFYDLVGEKRETMYRELGEMRAKRAAEIQATHGESNEGLGVRSEECGTIN